MLAMAFDMKTEATSLAGPKMAQFSPYAENGGSVVAIAGKDFAVIASDTRLSSGFSILSREQSKLHNLSGSTVLGCTGCWCDILTLTRVVEARLKMYHHEHNKPMTTDAVAQLISTLLYYKRFFPYYIANVVAGLDAQGRGVVYSYDPVGHMSKEEFTAVGSSSTLLQPLLDNQVGLLNMEGVTPCDMTQEKAIGLIKDVFISASERDIHCGDGVIINIITKNGIRSEEFGLRRD